MEKLNNIEEEMKLEILKNTYTSLLNIKGKNEKLSYNIKEKLKYIINSESIDFFSFTELLKKVKKLDQNIKKDIEQLVEYLENVLKNDQTIEKETVENWEQTASIYESEYKKSEKNYKNYTNKKFNINIKTKKIIKKFKK